MTIDCAAIPCGHMVERDPPACGRGFAFPDACPGCPEHTPGLNAQERTRCEIWLRVMGYHRPVDAWNPGKQAEHAQRRLFREPSEPLSTPHG